MMRTDSGTKKRTGTESETIKKGRTGRKKAAAGICVLALSGMLAAPLVLSRGVTSAFAAGRGGHHGGGYNFVDADGDGYPAGRNGNPGLHGNPFV